MDFAGLSGSRCVQLVKKALREAGIDPADLPFEAVQLVRLALAGGGRDNVTVIVLQIREKEPVWRRLFGRAGSKEAKG